MHGFYKVPSHIGSVSWRSVKPEEPGHSFAQWPVIPHLWQASFLSIGQNREICPWPPHEWHASGSPLERARSAVEMATFRVQSPRDFPFRDETALLASPWLDLWKAGSVEYSTKKGRPKTKQFIRHATLWNGRLSFYFWSSEFLGMSDSENGWESTSGIGLSWGGPWWMDDYEWVRKDGCLSNWMSEGVSGVDGKSGRWVCVFFLRCLTVN